MPSVAAKDTSGNFTYGTYNTSTQSWSLTVPPDDYVVRLDLNGGQWFNGQLPISATAAVNLVYYGTLSGNTTVAWTTTTATGRGDPKDPWPPPSPPFATLPTASFTWLDAQLQSASAQLPKDLELDFDEQRPAVANP
jgi:hypothetical protein